MPVELALPVNRSLLKNARQFAEFMIQPGNWTNLVLFTGTMLALVSGKDSKALAFSIGWATAGAISFIPSIYSRSWKNCSESYRRADRGLAYCEGWRRCLQGLKSFDELGAEATEELKRKSVDSIFDDGLAYVESGSHMRIS